MYDYVGNSAGLAAMVAKIADRLSPNVGPALQPGRAQRTFTANFRRDTAVHYRVEVASAIANLWAQPRSKRPLSELRASNATQEITYVLSLGDSSLSPCYFEACGSPETPAANFQPLFWDRVVLRHDMRLPAQALFRTG